LQDCGKLPHSWETTPEADPAMARYGTTGRWRKRFLHRQSTTTDYEVINVIGKGRAREVRWRRGAVYSIASFLVCLFRPATFPLRYPTSPWPRKCSVRRAPFPNRAFQSAPLSCRLSRVRCVDARDGERLYGNRPGFLSNRRALDSFPRASER
jgi:hypothetical protein